MRKKLLLTTMLAAAAVWPAASAQTLNATFEADSVTADGWTEVHAAAGKGLWTQTQYATETQFKGGSLTANKLGGARCAVSKTGGLMAIGKVPPSNWLISPPVTIGQGDALNFMTAVAAGYNTSNVTSDTQRIRLDVLVSTTTADTTAFTDTLMCEIPRAYTDWHWRSLDLSKYAGKTVRIAFHDHGSPISNFVSQMLFLDNVSIASEVKTDMSASHMAAFTSGTVRQQPVSVRVSNYGAAVSSFKVGYDIDGANAVTETISRQLASGGTLPHTFAQPATFEAGSHTVRAWVEASGDAYASNDTTQTAAEILESAALPYQASDANLQQALATSYSYRSTGWTYMDRYKAWVYTPAKKASVLYTTKGVSLKKGKVKVKMLCASTADNASVNVYLTQTKGKFETQAGTRSLKKTLDPENQNFTFDVPADGDYIIGLTATTTGQVTVSQLTYCEPYEDVQCLDITAPAPALLATAATPVTVRVRNEGQQVQSAVKVAYQIDGGTAVEEQIASLQPNQEVEYTFSKQANIITTGNHTLKAWASIANDGDRSNDSIAATVYAYAPHAFPYRTSFEAATDSLEWSSVNVDADATYWGVESTPGYAIDGQRTLYLNYTPSTAHNDYAVSPAIALGGGQKGRVSFYYGLSTTYGTSKMQILLTKDPSLEGLLTDAKVLNTINVSGKDYNYANAYFDIPDTDGGNYYFAILVTGGTDQIFVDDFRVDAANEVALVGASSSVTGSSYAPADGQLTVNIANYGLADMSGAKFTCKVTGTDGGKTVSEQTITGTYQGTIKAGETATYTLADKAQFTQPGTYTFAVSMTCDGDADSKNNTFQAEGPTKWATLTVPATIGFENATDNAALQLDANKKWTVSSYTPYQGARSLVHNAKAADASNGDWAFLNRVHLPAGTYNVSFFWKTMTGNTDDKYKQRFAVYVGTEAKPEAMTIKVAQLTDTLNADHKATKEMATVTIANEGDYCLGVQCTTANTWGYLVTDQFAIEVPAQGIAVTAEAPYKADFATREGEWYHYHPTATSNQWAVATEGGDTAVYASRTYTDWMKLWKTPSLYEAPAFSLEAGATYEATFGYSIAGTDAANPLNGESELRLLLADKDVPAAFTTTVASGSENYIAAGQNLGTASGTFAVPQSGVYYLAFLPESSVSAKFGIHSFELKRVQATGISTTEADGTTVTVKRNRVDISGHYTCCAIYTMGGVQLASVAGQSSVSLADLGTGVYAVKVTLPSGQQIVKKVAVTH